MLPRTLNLALVAAGAANAILIPPSVSAAELDLGDDMAMEVAASSHPRTVSLDCPTCDVAAKKDGDLVWTQRSGNTFILDFDVGSQQDSLNIDGVQLYPPTFGYFSRPFRVEQVNPDGENMHLRVTGYTFHYSSAETISEAGIELVPMTFQIKSIESQAVDPPALTINLLKDPSGRLIIANFHTATAVEPTPADKDLACNEWPLLCKWKAMMAGRLNGLTSTGKPPCHKHKGNPMASDTLEGKPPHRFRPGHPHHRPHHTGSQHPHRFPTALRRAFFTLLMPILIGIFAGTLTYLLGMALGCLVAIVIAKVRGESVYARLAQDDVAFDADEDIDSRGGGKKEDYLPRAYDAPPVYDAAEKEVVADEKDRK